MGSSRWDYYRYDLFDGTRKVYVSITNDSDRQGREHEDDALRFTPMEVVGPRVTRPTTERREEDRLAAYLRSHGGDNPKYGDQER